MKTPDILWNSNVRRGVAAATLAGLAVGVASGYASAARNPLKATDCTPPTQSFNEVMEVDTSKSINWKAIKEAQLKSGMPSNARVSIEIGYPPDKPSHKTALEAEAKTLDLQAAAGLGLTAYPKGDEVYALGGSQDGKDIVSVRISSPNINPADPNPRSCYEPVW